MSINDALTVLAIVCGIAAFWTGVARGEISGPVPFVVWCLVAAILYAGKNLS